MAEASPLPSATPRSSPPAGPTPTSPPPPRAPLKPAAEARVLCDRCLGRRAIGAAGVAPQREAARALRQAWGWSEVAEADCKVCEGAFADASKWLEAARLATAPFEHRTFQLGTQFATPCEALEREVAAAMGQEKVGESIRTEANRATAAAYAAATGMVLLADGRPDVKVTVDTRYWSCLLDVAPVYVAGRYNKLRRDIPQTHWPCRRCQGKGCWECDDTGVNYYDSVEDAVGKPALPLADGKAYSFHGAGREDIDALMLGTGRPFVLEVAEPRIRTFSLDALASAINRRTGELGVAVRELRFTDKDEVARIKEGEYQKEYVAHCVAESPVTLAAIEDACTKLTGTTLEQRTPDRVSHRRADLVRRRKLHEVRLEPAGDNPVAPGNPTGSHQPLSADRPGNAPPDGTLPDPTTRFSLRVRAESGTYIKETVSSDEGRTTPSVTALLGVQVKVEALDVVAILDHLPKEQAAE